MMHVVTAWDCECLPMTPQEDLCVPVIAGAALLQISMGILLGRF